MKYLRSTSLIFLLCGLWMHDAFDPMKAATNLNLFSQTGTTIDVNGGAMLPYQFSNLLAVQAELLYMGIGGGVSCRNCTGFCAKIGEEFIFRNQK